MGDTQAFSTCRTLTSCICPTYAIFADDVPLLLPHSYLGSLGITPETHLVFYDSAGIFSSPRAAFTFASFNHPGKLSILGACRDQVTPSVGDPR